MAQQDQSDDIVNALDRLRVRHLAFRRSEPEDIRELETMRLEVLKQHAQQSSGASTLALDAMANMQLRLLERAFYVLRLDHYANAPENQGWVNLFRRWGRSESFNAHYDQLKPTLSQQCRRFYETYLKECPQDMDDRPIHHPWQRTEADRGPGLFMDTGRVEPPIAALRSPAGAGGVEDAKGSSDADQTYEHPSGKPGESRGSRGKNE